MRTEAPGINPSRWADDPPWLDYLGKPF